MRTDRQLTSEGKEARSAYLRKWRKENREKCREYSDRYWSKRGMESKQKKGKGSADDNEQ